MTLGLRKTVVKLQAVSQQKFDSQGEEKEEEQKERLGPSIGFRYYTTWLQYNGVNTSLCCREVPVQLICVKYDVGLITWTNYYSVGSWITECCHPILT